jgi:hypothetical protein
MVRFRKLFTQRSHGGERQRYNNRNWYFGTWNIDTWCICESLSIRPREGARRQVHTRDNLRDQITKRATTFIILFNS